jgi:hypothetical protein
VVRQLGTAGAGGLGALLVAIANAWVLLRVGATPHYAAGLLPGQVIGGAGVGLVIPSLAGAATITLPPARFATGTAVISMTRQIGMVLGVALLVAIFGKTAGGVSLSAVRHGWTLVLVAAAAAAVATLAIGLRRPSPVPEAAAAESTS